MPLLGRHSRNPEGSPAVMAALQQLQQRAANGDQAAMQTLQTIAQGGTTSGSAVPGWNEDINWGDTKDERPEERAAAQALLQGDTGTFGSLAGRADATHQGWTGGTLAKAAPIAAAFIPGVGPLAAAAIGAGLGGLSGATRLTEGGAGRGAVRGGALAGSASVARGMIGGAGTPGAGAAGGGAAPQPGGEFDLPPLPGRVNPMGGGGVGGAVNRVGRFVLDNPELIAGGVGVLQAANQQGNADRSRSAALGALDDFGGENVSMPDFTDSGNPYSAGRTGRSRVSALNSLTRGY